MIIEREMSRGMMTLKIIWAAMLLSLALYLVAGRIVAPNLPAPMAGEVFATLRLALYAVGFATLIAARFIRNRILAGATRAVDPPPDRPDSFIQKYTTAVIVNLAMGESIGIYGLVLFLLGRDTTDLYILMGISAAALIYYRPRREELAGFYRGN